jgi:hypothetical protein
MLVTLYIDVNEHGLSSITLDTQTNGRPFSKWRPVEICQCLDIIMYSHIKF